MALSLDGTGLMARVWDRMPVMGHSAKREAAGGQKAALFTRMLSAGTSIV
jgi:hypothetical protein